LSFTAKSKYRQYTCNDNAVSDIIHERFHLFKIVINKSQNHDR